MSSTSKWNIHKQLELYKTLALIGFALFLALGIFTGCEMYMHKTAEEQWTNAKFIMISKQEMKLRVFDFKGNELLCVPCATGKNPGNKQVKGDMKTPEGVFALQDKQDATTWTHDFGDGEGEIEGAYGPRFLRLLTPGHKGIGIHGTHLPESVGTRASEGCIRLHNEDILKLDELVSVPCVVIITPGHEDAAADAQAEEAPTEKKK